METYIASLTHSVRCSKNSDTLAYVLDEIWDKTVLLLLWACFMHVMYKKKTGVKCTCNMKHFLRFLYSYNKSQQDALFLKFILVNFKHSVLCILSTYEMKNQQMSLFQFYSYIDGSLHVLWHTEHVAWTVQPLNQWLCEQLCEFSWGWACRPETCRDPSIYE
jgi:hypothetical protein